MKSGFTCPAGFNVVASANHSGRRLIVVVLGAPTARSRNQEAANLFDRGFAMGGGSGSLESLPSAGSSPPDMRADVCLRHNAAAIAAAEEEGVGDDPSQVATATGRGPRSPTRSRRCLRPRTPNSRTKGSILIRFAYFSVPPRAGRGQCLARPAP
jgi:D-alanyl-D-alanine carboxypeptidase